MLSRSPLRDAPSGMEGEIGESSPVLGERKPDVLPVSPNPDNDLLSGPVASTSLVTNGSRKALLDADPGLARAYAVAQRVRRAIRPVMTVEVTSTCNLYCEGCFYFHDDFEPQAESEDVGDWRSFFEDQYSMGRRYAVFHGAEPALKQKRLLAAAESFRRGIVYTNGTIRIDDDIPFIRCVSIWGSEETTGMIRGGSVYHKALRNFENDPKARFSVVISAQNYRDLPRIIADLHAAGVSATISYFSPSHSYMTKLRSSAPNDSEFFRFSNEDENMLMSSEEFAIVNDMIADLSSRYPQTVRQGPIFNQWLTSAGPRYTLDSHGMANECAVRPRDIHELYGTNLEPIRGKCALPDNDCSQCRITPVSTTSILHNAKAYSSSHEAISFWIESAFQAGQVFIRDDDRDVWGDAPPPMNGWQEHFGVASS